MKGSKIDRLGMYNLFYKLDRCKILFIEWCKKNDSFCEYDIEKIGIDLYNPVIGEISEYIHSQRGNILDFLEEQGYFISIKVKKDFKFGVTVHKNHDYREVSRNTLVFSNSKSYSRDRAYLIGISESLIDLEKN